jgi:hypothetical protein
MFRKNTFIFLLMTLFIFSHSSNAFYLDLGLGLGARALDGNQNYSEAPHLAAELSLGKKYDKWDFSLDSLFQASRQKDFIYNYNDQTFTDDYNWLQWQIGPTVKYHVKRSEGKGSWAPFLGVHYTNANLSTSGELVNPANNYDEDVSHNLWGYGAKFGVEISSPSQGKYLEAVKYKFFATHNIYRNMQGDFLSNGVITEFNGDPSDDLTETTLNFTISFSLGDKLFQKVKSKIN